MDRRTIMNFLTRRSTIWTLSLCLTGALALGGAALVDDAIRGEKQQKETELNELAYLEEEIKAHPEEVNDTVGELLQEEEAELENLAEVSGDAADEIVYDTNLTEEEPVDTAVDSVDNITEIPVSGGENTENVLQEAVASVDSVISEQALLDAGIQFTEDTVLMWPSAGTILIDYSMDGSVYFPTLKQYKYNPALIIGSETGNQVLASAKGIVESVTVNEETGTTLMLNIGNGYKLIYGQLKELAVTQGDVVEAGAVLGYVSEPTKYYSEEGSNLYFMMTQGDQAVDPVLYLEG